MMFLVTLNNNNLIKFGVRWVRLEGYRKISSTGFASSPMMYQFYVVVII